MTTSASDNDDGETALKARLALEAAHPARTIMLVDWDTSERRMLAGLLEAAGYHVLQAAHGAEALTLFAGNTPDLLLTDIVMPEKDGLELIQDVRKYHSKTTIIAMSGTARADDYLSVARLLGAKHTLKKPLIVNQLLQSLRNTD